MDPWLERLCEALAPHGIAVERRLGSGGMGDVVLARDVELDRRIAVKVLKPERASAVNAERFLREARRAARLNHENLVRVHRVGQAGGVFYYTMDYVEWPTLAKRLERGPLPPAEVLRLARDLLAALGAAHAHGLIHRDVKPGNIFFDGEHARLADFGIAYDLESSDTTSLTASDRVPPGTRPYMPPEQLRGDRVGPPTDIYAVGLVLYETLTGRRWMPGADPRTGKWRQVPWALRAPIRRALAIAPEDRWSGAAVFADALALAEEAGEVTTGRTGRTLRYAASAVAVTVAGAALWWILRPSPPPPPPYDVVVVPFTATGVPDSVATRLSDWTGLLLERSSLNVGPVPHAYYDSALTEGQRLEAVLARARARAVAAGDVRPRGARLEVRLQVLEPDGKPLLERAIRGDAPDSVLAEQLKLSIVEAVAHGGFHGTAPVSFHRAPLEARAEFRLGEGAFAAERWAEAERHYRRAWELDSTFVLAGWRLGNARRWLPLRGEGYPSGLWQVYQAHREALPEVDRDLIEAQFLPSGAARFRRYEDAVRRTPPDAHAALLYGDELFHRGPLAGRPIEDALVWLDRAIAVDSMLAPAWEHKTWALIRLGRGDEAREALEHLERLAGAPQGSEPDLPMFLRLAYRLRFGSAAATAEAQGVLRHLPGALALAARGALAFGLPEVGKDLGRALAASGDTPDQRASGLVAAGVSLMTLGRPLEALAALDSASRLFASPAESRLQAAEWRVVLPALGVPGVSEDERERGRAELLGLAGDTALGGRAAWALALDARARGDTLGARAWTDRVRDDGLAPALTPVLDGWAHAALRRWGEALAVSGPALAFDSAGVPDPFLRAAVHLLRGRWLGAMGQLEAADRSLLWYQNLDLRRWPQAEAQAAEVDWALTAYALALRARLAASDGRPADACALGGSALRVWDEPERAVRDSARRLLPQECAR